MREESSNSGVFGLFAKPVRSALAELGFSEATLPQKMAASPILAGENVLLLAPTGSGKTEAVLLPIFSKLVQQTPRKGIAVIYVTPLRALNRDLLKRLSFWSSRLSISIEVRHGDTELKLRRRQAIFPPDMLVTTPETLQAILPGSRMRQHLRGVQCVVVDEVHELASSKRGVQLAVALERLREVVGREFQRIGLSATVGNPDKVAQFLAGAERSVRIVEAVLPKGYRYHVENPVPVEADYDLARTLNTSPEAAARIRRVKELVDSHESTLIFVNSRTVAEMLGYRFNQLGRKDIAVHHGSLSKEERSQIEDEFKAGGLKAIVCTSTLELGIDIGHVDLVIQYLSPRQVSSLIQRVGRSGHRLDMVSEGVIITAFPDDTLESVAATRNAQAGRLEHVLIHENALDVLAHQIVGILMDKATVNSKELLALLRRAYPYRKLTQTLLWDVICFLERLGEVRIDQEGKGLTKGRNSRKYYYENLSMIPDERRYPIVNVISDRKIGSLGDEFMALKARVGLNFIIKGQVWRIVQIEEETGTVYVVPSEDPLAAVPGWDGEMLPVPFELAKETGQLRERIAKALKETGKAEATAEELAEKFSTDKSTLFSAVQEVEEHLKQGAPLPTDKHIVVEGFDKFLIVHACFGEMVNRTLGCIFDSVLSDREIIVGWWNDGYHILIETPRKLTRQELENTCARLFSLTSQETEQAFEAYLESKFPFSYKMKFVAERFGALPRGKTMSYERLSQLPKRFMNTPILDETLREAMIEKVDIKKAKEIMRAVGNGRIKVSTTFSQEKPTPLAYHMLAKFSDMSELMAPERLLLSNIDRMKKAIDARTASLLCMSCGQWAEEERIRDLQEQPVCRKCGSKLLAPLYPSQDAEHVYEVLKKRREGKEVSEEELKELTQARRTADLVLSYGKKAVVALEVKGVGPETASRILGKMHPRDDDFFMDLLKAKIQYLRTREYWKDRQERRVS
jgi:ATP-dependent helicase Lhr and Lhr-like helicase